MRKAITFNEVEYSMIEALAKKTRLNPEQYLKKLIKEQYERLK